MPARNQEITFRTRLLGWKEFAQGADADAKAVRGLGNAARDAGRKAGTSQRGFGVFARESDRTGRAARRANTNVSSFNRTLGGLGIGYGAMQGLRGITGAAVGFDTALREVGAVSGLAGKQLTDLGKIARLQGKQTGVGAGAATLALTELAKAGLSAAQLGPALQGTLLLAQAGSLDTATAAQAAANAMQTFGLRAQNVVGIADTLANAANLTTADVSDFAMALSQGGSAAKLAGVSFEDTILSLTQLARIGVKNSDAGTSMKTAFLQLANPTKKAKERMDELGLAFFDASGKMKSISEIGAMLASKLKPLSEQQRVATLQTIAGTDGFRTLAAAMQIPGVEADILSDQLGKTGSAAETAAKKNAGTLGQWRKFKANWQDIGITIGDTFLPAANKVLGWFNRTEWAAKALIGTLGTLLAAFVVGKVVNFARAIRGLAGAQLLLGRRTRAATAAQVLQNATAVGGLNVVGPVGGKGKPGKLGKLGSAARKVGGAVLPVAVAVEGIQHAREQGNMDDFLARAREKALKGQKGGGKLGGGAIDDVVAAITGGRRSSRGAITGGRRSAPRLIGPNRARPEPLVVNPFSGQRAVFANAGSDQPINITVQSLLDGKIVAENTMEYQLRKKARK